MLETSEMFVYDRYARELGNVSKEPVLAPPIYFYTSYNNNNDLINLEYEYKMPPAYTTENNSIPLNHSTQYARYLQYGIYWNGTDPTNNDTDRDGLKDGDELSISNPHNGVIENPYGNHFGTTLDPLNPDTDGDGIQDGQEYNGYTATYFMQVGDTNKKLSRKITDADPFSAFKLKDGKWLDTDEDKIPDIIERDPANMTRDIFDNIQNIDNFRWYYNKYKNDANDKNANNDENDNNDENNENAKDAQDKITNQFNPNVVECIIPVTDNINVLTNSDVGWDHANAWTDITIDVRDTVGIKKVILEVTDCNHKVTLYSDDAEKLGDGWLRFKTTIDIDFWGDYLLDYTVKVKVIDLNGNSFVTEKKVNGVFGGIINAIVDAVKGFLEAAWEAAKGLVDALLNWIEEMVKSMVEKILEPLYDVLEKWGQKIADIFANLILSDSAPSTSGSKDIIRLTSDDIGNGNDIGNVDYFLYLFLPILGYSSIRLIAKALAWGVTAIQTTIGVLSKAAGGLGSIADWIVEAIVAGAKKAAKGLLISAVVADLVISFLIGTILPADSPIWSISISAGLSIATMVYVGVRWYMKKVGWEKAIDKDAEALADAILSIFFIMVSSVVKVSLIEILTSEGLDEKSALSAALSVAVGLDSIGVILALCSGVKAFRSTMTLSDRLGGAVGYIDEMIDLFALGYSIGSFVGDANELIELNEESENYFTPS